MLYLALALVAFVGASQLLAIQLQAFGRQQGLVLLIAEAGASGCLAYIAEVRKRNKPYLTTPLLWAAISIVLFAMAFLQLPGNRIQRYETRVAESRSSLLTFHTSHPKASCRPLEAELRARELELAAARQRISNIYSFSKSFQAGLIAVGASAAAAIAILIAVLQRRGA